MNSQAYKKKLLLIALADVSAYGVRRISAYLKKQGLTTDILALRLSDNKRSLFTRLPGGKAPDSLFKNLMSFIQPYDNIGISLFSDGYFESTKITQEIKKNFPEKNVIWGGIHPTLKPKECLKIADYVCVGEGYNSLKEFLSKNCFNAHIKESRVPVGIWGKNEYGIPNENGCSEVLLTH